MSDSKNLWGGRFTGEADRGFVDFNRSFGFDRRMFAADVRASVAHCNSLASAGVLTGEEAIVSSPAIVPTISSIAAPSMFTATAEASPGSVRATIRFSPAISRLKSPRAAAPFARGTV